MGGVRITKKDGQILLGRVINSDDRKMSFMVVGNQLVNVPREEIDKMENENKSLMYEGLIEGMTKDKVNALLDYMVSLSSAN
jgi:putative heme-binding domain-containing protein